MEPTVVSEKEREAIEEKISLKLGEDAPNPAQGSAGNSPYSRETVVFRASGSDAWGTQVSLVAVCRSHDGGGRYKGRGRWREVSIISPDRCGPLAVCDAGDRDAAEVGFSGLYVRPWETHREEARTGGIGKEGLVALNQAFEVLGL